MFDHVSANVEAISHAPGGGNVVYLEGHVDWAKYPAARFPVSRDSSLFMGRWDRIFNPRSRASQ